MNVFFNVYFLFWSAPQIQNGTGASFATGNDVALYGINLADPPEQPKPLIKPDSGNVVRSVAISSDGGSLASSICEIDEFELVGCRLDQIPVEGGSVKTINELPGVLSQIAAGVGIVAPASDTNPEFVAGIDLESGKELWRIDGQIETWRIVADRELVVSRFEPGDQPRWVLESIDLRGGDRRTVIEQSGDAPPHFWADQSTDDFLVVSNEPDIETGLVEHPDGFVPVLIVDRSSGSVDSFLLFVGKRA